MEAKKAKMTGRAAEELPEKKDANHAKSAAWILVWS